MDSYYYASRNEWVTDFNDGVRGLNVKGTYVCLDMNEDRAEFRYKSVHIAPGLFTHPALRSHRTLIGVLMDDMILGKNPLTDVWVRVRSYGHVERLMLENSVASDDDDQSGIVAGLALISGMMQLVDIDRLATESPKFTASVALIDTTVNPAVLTMDGTDTATVTWPGQGPALDITEKVSQAGNPTVPYAAPMIGWRIPGSGILAQPPEVKEGHVFILDGTPVGSTFDFRITEAFVNFLNTTGR